MARNRLTGLIALVLGLTACGGSGSTTTLDPFEALGLEPTTTTAAPATTQPDQTQPPATTTTLPATTTTTVFDRLVDITAEPPPAEEVTLTTEDDVELFAKWWPGNDTAVIVAHDFTNLGSGSRGAGTLQDHTTVLAYTGAIAREGFSVLTFDFRGHGQSGGEHRKQDGPIDHKAAFTWVADQGYARIILVGWVGGGTTGVVTDATDNVVDYDGIAMLFSPPQETGLDASATIGDLSIPVWFVGSRAGQSVSWAKRMAAKTQNSQGVYEFDSVPSGFTFGDIYGPELAGRLLNFIDSVP